MSASISILRKFASEGSLTLRVAGDCMSPILTRGEIVDVVESAVYLPGDIVAFARADGALVVHRFLGYAWKERQIVGVTQADDSTTRDAAVPLDRIVGRVVCRHRDGASLSPSIADRTRACASFCSATLLHLLRRGRA